MGRGRWAYKACPTTDTHTNRMFLLVDCHIWDSIISNERKVFARDLSCIGTYWKLHESGSAKVYGGEG